MSVEGIKLNREIPRVSHNDLTFDDFYENYFLLASPVIITGATEHWPARKWTIPNLMERVGENQVWIRGKTNQEDYKVGKSYTIRKDTFGNYCQELLDNAPRARSSYLAVASMTQAFPQLMDDAPLPEYLTANGKIHLGPYMWVAMKGHYEFCHFDPDDNFLIMIQGRKQVRLFGHDITSLYPNPLGSHGKTIQSRVNCETPDFNQFPLFRNAICEHCVLHPGEMLFIPAFYWHQVSALDNGISLNTFYGDNEGYIHKILKVPYVDHFQYWLCNIITQNLGCESFARMLPRIDEVLANFFVKQWHDKANPEELKQAVEIVKKHLNIEFLPPIDHQSRFPPVLKIRGLLFRDKNKRTIL